eukprot:13879773-Heterocapsa_arctica.AAC.1
MPELCDHELPGRQALEEGPPEEGVVVDNPLLFGVQKDRKMKRTERVKKGNDRGELHLSEEK